MKQTDRYEQYTIHEAVENLAGFKFVLPSFQRRMVWKNIQIRDLFNTIIHNNLFGTISAVKQTTNERLFDFYRDFDANNFETQYSRGDQIICRPPLYYIIDGQQRLTAIYNGLYGKNIRLYFDTDNCEFVLDTVRGNCIEVKRLYSDLKTTSYIDYCKSIHASNSENIFKFYYSFFFIKSINISLVFPSTNETVQKSKERFIELFIKLNTGGTNLTQADVTLCTLKGFEVVFEKLIDFMYSINENVDIFPQIFVDSLLLFRDRSKLQDENDVKYGFGKKDPVLSFSDDVFLDYQSVFEVPFGEEEQNEIEPNETEQTDDEPTKIEKAIGERTGYITLIHKKIVYQYDKLDVVWLKQNIASIHNVLVTVKPLVSTKYSDMAVYKLIMPILLARLYYSNDITTEDIQKKLDEYKDNNCNQLVFVDLPSIDKIQLNNFYTEEI